MYCKMKKNFLFILIGYFFCTALFLNSYQHTEDEVSLRISPLLINFPAADPDSVPVISSDSQVRVEIVVGVARSWNLTVTANGNLKGDKGASIPINNVSWTASPSPPFINGTLVRMRPQLMAKAEGDGEFTGDLNFFLANSWDYQAGEYRQTITFTLAVL